MSFPVFFFLVSILMVSGLACHFDWPPVPSTLPSPTSSSSRHQSEDEDRLFRQFRLDIIKEKMLRSLGMVSAPKFSPSSSSSFLPSLSSNYLRSDLKRLPLSQHRVPRDPSANPRSSRVIVFAELGSFRGGMCQEPSNVTMSKELSTLSFKLPHSPILIRNAILWYKTTNSYQVSTSTTSGQAWLCPCTTTILTEADSVPLPTDCMKLVLNSASSVPTGTISRGGPAFGSQKGWSSIRLGEFGTKVGPMITPDRRILFVLGDKIRMTERKRPFLVLEVGNETPKRTKRSAQVDCSADRAASCCRTRFWVDIRQLGWADWIISPAGFYYHYCKGHCTQGFDSIVNGDSMASTVDHSSSSSGPLDYSQVMNAYVRRFALNLRPCCVPRKMSHLPVVITTDGVTMNRTYIPNFIVNDCACLGVA